MLRRFSYIAAALALAAALLPADAEEPPVVVGVVVSQTGSQATLAQGYGNALLLWQEQINAAGGLLGRKVELRMLDDHSEAARAGPAYASLVADGASLLVGPYGSAATLVAGAEADRARHVMANGGGASSRVYKRPQRYVFQTLPPYSSYGEGVLELAREAGCASLLIFARNDVASVEMADAARERALKTGLKVAEVEVYEAGEDVAPRIAKARQSGVDGWLAFGEVRDAADLVIAMKRAGYAPRFFYASSAGDPRFIERVGQDGEFTLGSLAYDPALPTPYNAGFVAAYVARWHYPPDAAAAQGYAAAAVLARAAERAGSLDQEKLRQALLGLETGTVLGTYRVAAGGEQIGMRPAVIQILRGRREVLWPRELRGEAALQPYVDWKERVLLR
jgi:branched-chain amino acid transport system substrate-binding protein